MHYSETVFGVRNDDLRYFCRINIAISDIICYNRCMHERQRWVTLWHDAIQKSPHAAVIFGASVSRMLQK